MKSNHLITILRFLIVSAIVFPAILLFSFTENKNFYDIWQQLGITEKDAQYNIKESVLSGYLNYAGVRNFKNIATGDRAAVTRDLIAYTKLYVSGESFKKEYERVRASRKPVEPKKPKTAQEVSAEKVASLNESIANMEKSMKTANEDTKKMLKSSMQMLEDQKKMYQDPNSEMMKLVVLGEQNQYDWQSKQYAEDKKKWEQSYPADPNQFVKQRLQKMLDATKDIDYAAALTERNGKQYFVNKEYERKPAPWKMAFRAGKEVTETARKQVQQWLMELN